MDIAQDLIYWREPMKSGIMMVIGLTMLISLSCLSIISIVAYAGLALLCCTAGYRMYCFLLGSSKINKSDSTVAVSDPFRAWLSLDFQLPREKIASRVAASSDQINAQIKFLQDMILLKNYFDTFQFVVLLYLLSVLGSYFNLLTLITVAFTLGMTLPKVYIMYQPQFDSVFCKLKKQGNSIYAKIRPTLLKLRGAGQRT